NGGRDGPRLTIRRARIARGKGAFIMHRRSVRAAGIMLTAVVVTVGIGARVRAQRGGAAQNRPPMAPQFEVDPLWPKPLPNHWVLGSIGGIGVDDQDHVWILHRGSNTLAENFKQLEFTPPWAMCCASA